MKKNFYLVLVLIITIVKYGRAQEESLTQHVVLVSVDGFRPNFYLEDKWPTPNLKKMVREGAAAMGVRGVFPSVTYPSHTTIITGAYPAEHGVFYNSPFEEGGQTGRWYWESSLIQTETLWHAVKSAGKTSASFIWPVSVGAPIDYNIPEYWLLNSKVSRIESMRTKENPKGFLKEMEEEVLGKLNEKTFNGDYLNREDRTGEMAAYTLEKYKPNLMTLHLIATDHFQHEQGRDGEKVYTAIAAVDRAIGKIMEAAERADILDKTTFIITGDHGFVDIHSALNPNIWLVEEGLMEDQKDRGNWKAAFHTSGASAFLMLKDKNDKKSVAKVRAKLNGLPASIKKLFRVVEREELVGIGADPNAVLALAPIPGIAMSSRTNGEVLSPRRGGTHGFFPDFKEIETGFIAFGAGVYKGKKIEKMGLEDIAPVVSELLQLNFESKHGILYPGILTNKN
ncbi:alkaline phosphatase family protein [Zobellia alginiliquefaciens]|uniref:alkaline phosphatase family protein n=1 Tax=Zobellia alginiliquefaciens TaxID=3032586 RepID=UPI0023E364C0|nr:ectonucleotide pyrophosphatase/phosphodiesterase [Zobellia alginiliquefaciens]